VVVALLTFNLTPRFHNMHDKTATTGTALEYENRFNSSMMLDLFQRIQDKLAHVHHCKNSVIIKHISVSELHPETQSSLVVPNQFESATPIINPPLGITTPTETTRRYANCRSFHSAAKVGSIIKLGKVGLIV
jgi:hypothetical protein